MRPPQLCFGWQTSVSIRTLVTSIMGLSRILLEDGVVTKLEWLLVTRFVSEGDLGTENGVPV